MLEDELTLSRFPVDEDFKVAILRAVKHFESNGMKPKEVYEIQYASSFNYRSNCFIFLGKTERFEQLTRNNTGIDFRSGYPKHFG